jgi:TctA family transporter
VSSKSFLIIIGGLSTVNVVLSFVTLYVLNKARNGAVVTVAKLVGTINLKEFILFLAVALTAGGCATLIASKITKIFSKFLVIVNYKILSIGIIIIILTLVLIISNTTGLLILITSTSLGYYVIKRGIKRNYMMGCLLIPVMIYFLF